MNTYYTVVCRYYTINGIIEFDLYDVFIRLHIEPYLITSYGKNWNHMGVVRHHVYTGQTVQYVIKQVKKDPKILEKIDGLYSIHPPYSILYDCRLDLKDVVNMNEESIRLRKSMDYNQFMKVYGGYINDVL